MLLGVHLTLLIGPTVAVPAPPILSEALQNVEVTHTDEGRSGFQITFQVGRSGPLDLLDYRLVSRGYKVIVARDGGEALERLQEVRPGHWVAYHHGMPLEPLTV